MSALIQLALVQKQLAFWTQLAYNFRHCGMQCSATELQQPDNQQPPQSSNVATIFTFLYFRLIPFISSMKQDALDTTILSHHPYILCHFSSFACSLSVGSYNFLHYIAIMVYYHLILFFSQQVNLTSYVAT